MKKVTKVLFLMVFTVAMFSVLMVADAGATATGNELLWGTFQTDVEAEMGLGTQDIRVTIAAIINVALGLLGIVAVVIVLTGGFKWMTAGGDEGKVDEAKNLIKAGVIGLAIIVTAYAIANFVISSLITATTTGAT